MTDLAVDSHGKEGCLPRGLENGVLRKGVAQVMVLPVSRSSWHFTLERYFERIDLWLLGALILGLSIRLVLAPFSGDMTHDVDIWIETGRGLYEAKNPYTFSFFFGTSAEDNIGYMSPWPLLNLASYWLATMLFPRNIYALVALIKLPVILADVAISIVIYRFILRRTGILEDARRGFSLWLFNPLVIYVSSIYGMFDSLPTLFTLLCMCYFVEDRRDLSALCLAIAIGFKTYPIITVPLILMFLLNMGLRSGAIRYLKILTLVISSLSIPFLLWDWRSYLCNVVCHLWRPIHGFTPIDLFQFHLDTYLADISLSLFLLVVPVTLALFHRCNPPENVAFNGFLAVLLSFLASFKVLHDNFFIWVLPFMIVDAKVWHPRREPFRWLYLPFFIVGFLLGPPFAYFTLLDEAGPHHMRMGFVSELLRRDFQSYGMELTVFRWVLGTIVSLGCISYIVLIYMEARKPADKRVILLAVMIGLVLSVAYLHSLLPWFRNMFGGWPFEPYWANL